MSKQAVMSVAFMSAAVVVLASYCSMLSIGISVAVVEPNHVANLLLVVAAFAYLAFRATALCTEVRRPLVRITLGTGALLLGVMAFVGVITMLLAKDTRLELLGVVSTPNGRLAAYQNSVPVVSDSVFIEEEKQLAPGIYFVRSRALLDPAWEATASATRTGDLLVSYTDAQGRSQNIVVSP